MSIYTIYKICNDINDLVYVGATSQDISDRWEQHQIDSKRSRFQKRPLYKDMLLYGACHFYPEAIEQTEDVDEAIRLECFWIEKLGSFSHGYNLTFGGPGKNTVAHEPIIQCWTEGLNILQISNKLKCSQDAVRYVLDMERIVPSVRKCRVIKSMFRPVDQYDALEDTLINRFDSISTACKFLGVQSSGHIASVCRGERKIAYGFKWKYAEYQ